MLIDFYDQLITSKYDPYAKKEIKELSYEKDVHMYLKPSLEDINIAMKALALACYYLTKKKEKIFWIHFELVEKTETNKTTTKIFTKPIRIVTNSNLSIAFENIEKTINTLTTYYNLHGATGIIDILAKFHKKEPITKKPEPSMSETIQPSKTDYTLIDYKHYAFPRQLWSLFQNCSIKSYPINSVNQRKISLSTHCDIPVEVADLRIKHLALLRIVLSQWNRFAYGNPYILCRFESLLEDGAMAQESGWYKVYKNNKWYSELALDPARDPYTKIPKEEVTISQLIKILTKKEKKSNKPYHDIRVEILW